MPYKTKEAYNAWKRQRHALNMEAYRALKEATPCADCKRLFPHYVMDFDHIPERGKKVKNVAILAGSRKLTAPTLIKEMAKCELVCANCHKIRTHTRGQKQIIAGRMSIQ